jgi:hypothetical protein
MKDTILRGGEASIEQLEAMTFIPNYVALLYSTLVAQSPIDTGNLRSNITLEYYGEAKGGVVAKIIISRGVEYARYTNENSYGPKQQYNYLWVDRCVAQVSKILGSDVTESVEYEQL